MRIDDVTPTVEGSTLALPGLMQSVSGKALCIATSIGGNRAYLGGHSGVWRSDDGGATWRHLTRSQPAPGQTAVPGALMVPNVYDVLVSPADEDIVFVATGRDPRRPALNGVYRSTNGGTTWTRVHQFVTVQGEVSTVRNVGCLAVAPDNPLLVYAAGQSAIGISTDGGVTWVESVPQQSPGQIVNLVAVGPQTGAIRHVYAVGSRVWHSTDGGQTWQEDPVALSLGFPSDTLGTCARALAIHPGAPTVIYLNSNGNLFRGDFSGASAAVWTQLPPVPVGFPSTTASGTDYIVAHVTPEGQLLLFASDRRSAHVAVGEPASTSAWRRIDGNPVHVDPHGLALTPNFRLLPAGPSGRIYMVNDGGVVFSVDGAASWQKGQRAVYAGSRERRGAAARGSPAVDLHRHRRQLRVLHRRRRDDVEDAGVSRRRQRRLLRRSGAAQPPHRLRAAHGAAGDLSLSQAARRRAGRRGGHAGQD